MEYINKKTGEVFQADEVTLSNLCDGDLDFIFKGEFRKLINELNVGDKGSIIITVKVNRDYDASMDEVIQVECLLGTKYPKIKLNDDNKKRIGEDGKVLQIKEANMFSEAK